VGLIHWFWLVLLMLIGFVDVWLHPRKESFFLLLLMFDKFEIKNKCSIQREKYENWQTQIVCLGGCNYRSEIQFLLITMYFGWGEYLFHLRMGIKIEQIPHNNRNLDKPITKKNTNPLKQNIKNNRCFV
jgi:hypothetical protein